MVAIAELCRLHGPDYRAQVGDRLLPSPLRAMHDIAPCRTEALGGQLYDGDQGRDYHDRSHSCKNRHGPKCQTGQAPVWLENQTRLLLPVTHFMVTCTRPAELSAGARRHQKTIYPSRFRASSEA
jgi:hypothetical protein